MYISEFHMSRQLKPPEDPAMGAFLHRGSTRRFGGCPDCRGFFILRVWMARRKEEFDTNSGSAFRVQF